MSKILVAYFSASGITESLAQTLAQAAGADLFAIRPKVSYTPEDLNWSNPKSRSTLEMKDSSCRPPMAEAVDVSSYDVIFVGFPIWWYEAPRIIATFLESCDFSGKTVIPFATSGGSGMGKTDDILQKLAPSAQWRPGRRFSAGASRNSLSSWVELLLN